MRWRWHFLLVFVLWSVETAQALADKRIALIIGNSAYQQLAELHTPVNDAVAIANLLKNAGFDLVELHRDVVASDMQQIIRDFSDRAGNADIALVFYSGYGLEMNGVNYLIPVDAKLQTDIDLKDRTIVLERLLAAVSACKIRVIIVDASQDNPVLRTIKPSMGIRSVGFGLGEVDPTTPDTLIAFSTRPGSTTIESGNSFSPFTAALLKHLTRPGLDVRLALRLVREEVFANTNRTQQPIDFGSLGEETVSLVPPSPEKPKAEVGHNAREDRAPMDRMPGPKDKKSQVEDGSGKAGESLRTGTTAPTRRQVAARANNNSDTIGLTGRSKRESSALHGDGDTKVETGTNHAGTETRDPKLLTRKLQAQLRRVGCYTGNLDAQWDRETRQALIEFNKHALTKLDVQRASLEALEAVQSKTRRVCLLACSSGHTPKKGLCIGNEGPIGDTGAARRLHQAEIALQTRRATQAGIGGKNCHTLFAHVFCE
jgi:hypothetical protein